MTREDAIKTLHELWRETNDNWYEEAYNMAIEALSSDAIAKAYNQGFVEGSVNATVNSNYICPRCGEKMERRKE